MEEMMRCISNALVVIMLIGIVVVCTVIAGIIGSNLLQQQIPRGASISVSKAVWYATSASQGYVYIFDLTILNSGTEKANITNISATIGGNKYTIAQNAGIVKPNGWIQVVGSVNANVVPTNTDILVEVNYCSEGGFCGSVVAPAKPG
ncbi:MAG: hypothetical protein QW584_03525 [Thermofilaceae archaeon]